MAKELRDNYGRLASNLRVSVTDRCNLRCRYCVVSDQVEFLPHSKVLTFEEVSRLVRIASEYGVDRIRVTGGEPLVRKDVTKLIRHLANLPKIRKVNMTTNGLLLGKYFEEIRSSGLHSMNVSLDTLQREKYTSVTGKDGLGTVIDNILRVHGESDIKVKVNIVALRGFNEMEANDFVQFAIDHDLIIRFIEFMPFNGNNWLPNSFISSGEIKSIIGDQFTLVPEELTHPSQTSRVYRAKGHSTGRVGFISSVSESFCQWCNRLRLTVDGNLRPCLHDSFEVPLKPLLEQGASDDQLAEAMIMAVRQKQKEHVDFLVPDFQLPTDDREMIRIGG